MNEELKIIISAEINDLKNKVKEAKKDVGGIEKEMKSVSDKTKNHIKSMSDSIHKGFKQAAKATAAVTTAIGGITVAAVKGFAKYEQLKGGVEKLFKSSSKEIMSYAENAYKTTGLTANQYMETVTGFSAGLIAAMGGDTAAAAKVADMAINDMADNASVFGTSIGDIQNAYQGFAKQNYTMLDNLKLGYGGTREEMQRLLDDAQKISGIEYDMSNLDDVYEAIHVVQQEMEITGNAADEASKTIEGSINAAKSAWSNLITGLADDEANIPQLVQNVVDTSTQVIRNIVPIVQEVLKHIPEAISEVSPEAGEAFQALLDAATPIFEDLKELVGPALDVITDALEFIADHTTAFEVLAGSVLVFVGAVEAMNIALGIYNGILTIKNGLEAVREGVMWAVAAAEAAAGLPLWAIIAIIAAVIGAITAIILVIKDLIKNWDTVKESTLNCWNTLKDAAKEFWNNLKEGFNNLKEKICEIFTAIKDWVVEKWNSLKETVVNVTTAIKEGVVNKFNAIKDGIKEKIENAKTAVHEKFESIKTGVSEKVEAVKTKVTDTFNRVKDAITKPVETAKTKVKALIDKIKGFFKFEWSLPHLKMPSVKITGKFNLLPPSVPHFSLSWHKMGGVFDAPTLFGFNGGLHGLGEDGAEAIVPLEKNTKWLDRMATMLAEKQGGGRPIYLQVDGKTFAQISVDSINDLTKQTGSLPLVLA